VERDREQIRAMIRKSVSWGDWRAAFAGQLDPELRGVAANFIALVEEGDLDGLESIVSPDVVVIQPPELPDAKTYRGFEGFIEAFLDWPSQWEETRIEPVRSWQVGPGAVVLQTHQKLRGAGSGIEFEADFWFALTWRDGFLERWTMHITPDEAERAAGAQA
jgi:ketosteroid isomerase-like protein